jgi:hypothetical protein
VKLEIYLGIILFLEIIISQIKTHMISSITRHTVWNIKFFFLSSDLIMKIVNFFSLSCAVLCCSSNYCVLRIARCNDFIINKLIPGGLRRRSAASFLLGIVSSNPTECIQFCRLCVLCVVR